MNDGNGKDLSLPGIDPFVSYGGGGSGITGGAQLLIYSKGEYNYGIDRVNLPLGTKMVFNLPAVRAGYRKWVNNQIASMKTWSFWWTGRDCRQASQYDATDTREWEATATLGKNHCVRRHGRAGRAIRLSAQWGGRCQRGQGADLGLR